MKKTFTVNLNNIVFHVDDDAYEMLQKYLADIAIQFQSVDEQKEIMADIEARIAELFTERLQKNKHVVTTADVEAIIEIMGKPNQYADEDPEPQTASSDKKVQNHRRFYRDPENTVFAGIAGGISAYFDWDVTLVRIIMVLLVFLGAGFIIPVYLVVWFVVPQALTASQRLEMQGEEVTVESIKAELNNVKNYVESEKFKQSAKNFGEKAMSSMPLFLKVVFGFIGGVIAFTGIALISVLVIILCLLLIQPILLNDIIPGSLTSWVGFATENSALFIVSLILLISCPIYLIVNSIRRAINGRRGHNSKIGMWIAVTMWIVGIVLFYSVGIRTFVNLDNSNGAPFGIAWGDEDSTKIDEQRNLATFNAIEISGNIELVLTQDSVQKVVVSAQSEFMPHIITSVENGILLISTEKIFLNRAVKVTISSDSLQSIEAKGAATISTVQQQKFRNLSLSLVGASQAIMDVNVVNTLNLEIKGASKAELSGTAQSLKIRGVGASQVEAFKLITQNATVEMVGASQAEIHATQSIDAQAKGASHIDCQGSPKTVKQKDTGASQIIIE